MNINVPKSEHFEPFQTPSTCTEFKVVLVKLMLRFGGKQQLQVKPINFSLENTVILDSKTISITDYVSAWHHLLISLPASERMQAVEI